MITNLFVLLGFAAVCSVFNGCALLRRRTLAPWAFALLYGVMGVVVMLTPVVTHSGLTVDCRGGVLGTAAGRGQVTISTYEISLSEEERTRLMAGLPACERHQGRFAVLEVRDTGCGMTAETAGRIFEPFFTTKADRKNAGLGLPTVYAIVQQHHGFIDVQTQPGCGSTFLIYLPVTG